MNRIEWYEIVANKICDNLEQFYADMYGQSPQSVGFNYRINPCPECGHNDCCTISANNAVHCFSCGWSGTHISAYIDYARKRNISRNSAIRNLERWSGVAYPRGNNDAEIAAFMHYSKIQEIKERAVDFFHLQLMKCDDLYEVYINNQLYRLTPLEYQQQIRKHTISALKAFKVMFTQNYKELWQSLIDDGYTKEEIKEAKIWFPENTFVYPYFHPYTRDILRFNVKNSFNATIYNAKTGKEEVVKGYSTGSKVFGFSPKFSFKQPIIVVEGENDAITVFEQGWVNVCWTGGTLTDAQLNILEAAENIIYTAYDNDEAGQKYYEKTQQHLPHKDVRPISFDSQYNDIDEYYHTAPNPKPISELIEQAPFVQTDKFVIRHKDVNYWEIKNRHQRIEFEITGRDTKTNEVIGKINYFVSDKGSWQLKDRDIGKTLIKAKLKPFNFYLADAIDEFFNANLEDRTFEELIKIYFYTSHRAKVIRLLAQYLHRASGTTEHDALVDKLKCSLDADTVDEVLKEFNDIQNEAVLDQLTYIPKIKVSQYFNVRNGDAYMYFTRDKRDGDVSRRIPFLLRNDGTCIRLDLLKRKDPQCLLLIDNKYELPTEIPGPIMKHEECSLWSTTVDKFIEGKISEEDINPGKLVQEIENWIRKFYYFKNTILYKILALYIYGTYFYELFGVYPYLLLNGEKGSGKSTLDTVLYLLCFNAKHAINITDASLYRIVAIEGGTMILDEMENLTSRTKSADSVMASVLKGGYARAGSVYRFNTETGLSDGFEPYGPKIISNIFGIEDIIGDRCIEIKTYRMKLEDNIHLEDPKMYISEKLDIIRDLTGRCCISALTYFKLMYKIFESKDNKIKTHSPRSYQLICPLLATARLADLFITGKYNNLDIKYSEINGPYEKALTLFHDTIIMEAREAADATTPEGIVKYVITNIARELAGKISGPEEKQYTIPEYHKYTEPIIYNEEEGWFEVNVLHLKCFIEEHLPGESVNSRNVAKWVRSVFPIDPENVKRRIASFDNEDLVKEFKGNRKVRVNYFRFYIDDILYSNNLISKEQDKQDNELNLDDRLF